MRSLFVHPNDHSGGAEIAGTWPPASVAYLTGSLRKAGFDVHFIDAMTDTVTDGDLRAWMAELAPDVVGTTAISPAIYVAETVLQIASEVVPGVPGGGFAARSCTCRSCRKRPRSTWSCAARAKRS